MEDSLPQGMPAVTEHLQRAARHIRLRPVRHAEPEPQQVAATVPDPATAQEPQEEER